MPYDLLADTDISEECACLIFTFELGGFGNVLNYVGTIYLEGCNARAGSVLAHPGTYMECHET
jgi:hypothetical protein